LNSCIAFPPRILAFAVPTISCFHQLRTPVPISKFQVVFPHLDGFHHVTVGVDDPETVLVHGRLPLLVTLEDHAASGQPMDGRQ
jgi:hypothetical protein